MNKLITFRILVLGLALISVVACSLPYGESTISISTNRAVADAKLSPVFSKTAWTGGYTGQIVITNTGTSTASNWSLDFNLPTGTTITSFWNASIVSSAGKYAVSPLAYNKEIPAGGSVTFGFNVNGSAAPANIVVSGGTTGTPIPVTPVPVTPKPSVPPTKTLPYFAQYQLDTIQPEWDGHYQMLNTDINPDRNFKDVANNQWYTWQIVRATSGIYFMSDYEASGNVQGSGNPLVVSTKSRAELWVPLHKYQVNQENKFEYSIVYTVPKTTDYGDSNSPYWITQVIGTQTRPMMYVSLGKSGIPILGVYGSMKADGTASYKQFNFTLAGTTSPCPDIRGNSPFTLTMTADMSPTAASPALVCKIIQNGSTYVASAANVVLTAADFPDFNIFLKFGSYNGGGTQQHAKVYVDSFSKASNHSFPTAPILGAKYFLPSLHTKSVGNYNGLSYP